MAGVKDSFLDLERHRLRLQDNVAQLRKALQHWQTWDAEYEALKEEIDAAADSLEGEAQELRRIRAEYEGELLRGKELDDVLGRPVARSREHVAGLLQRRIDYVTRNVESLQRQLEAVENKLAAATVVSQPDAADEDSEPFTEIIENLDQDDNVVSYRLNRPGDSVSHIREALTKAGVEGLSSGEPGPQQRDVESHSAESENTPAQRPPTSGSEQDESRRPAPKRAVSLVQDADAANTTSPPGMPWKAKRVERIMETAREQEAISRQEPVIPKDEDPEDAALRQQMLEYSMGEVGSVVAELELEEVDSDQGQESDDDHGDTDQDEGEDDGEDRFGRSTSRMVTDGYRQRMLELESRLGIKSRFTQGPGNGDSTSDAHDDEGVGRIVVKESQETPPSASKPSPIKSSIRGGQNQIDEKKGVRFAQMLDVAPDGEPLSPPVSEREEALVEPLSDVVERSGPAGAANPTTKLKAAGMKSRFARAREVIVPGGDIPKGPLDAPSRFAHQERWATPPPTGPAGTTLADRLVEREPRLHASPHGELDGSLAGQHQALRRRFIQRQGGFLLQDESPVQHAAGGAPEPISRFKAARLSLQ